MTETRFIGGPLDGKRMIIDIPDDGRIQFPEWKAGDQIAPGQSLGRVHIYEVEQDGEETVARYTGSTHA